jgi:CheY-like chemotaxis protein
MDDTCLLIVEPDVLVRTTLAEYLRGCGYRVLEVADGAEAREILSEPSAGVDIVLASVYAPKEGGFLLALWVKANCPHIDVELVGSVASAVEKASDICADGPTPSAPYNYQFLHDRILQLLAARDRAKEKDET